MNMRDDQKTDRFKTLAGTTLIDQKVGAAMHSRIGAWAEAQAIYVAHSALHRRTGRPLRVLDVGLGIAANALALLEAWDHIGQGAGLEIVSVENAPSGLRAALDQRDAFDFLERHRDALDTLLRDGYWENASNSWRLLAQDYETAVLQLRGQSFDLIYYDLYGPSEQPAAWEMSRLTPTARLLHPKSGLWMSYASATRVRTALLLSGLSVRTAPATSIKREMTLAFAPQLDPRLWPDDSKALGPEFLDHLRRSAKPWPDDLPPLNHAQAWIQLESQLK